MSDQDVCTIGAFFLCKPDLSRPTAKLEIVLPPDRQDPARLVCRVVQGVLVDLSGRKWKAGTLVLLPTARVAAAVRRYRARETGKPLESLPPNTTPGSDSRVNVYNSLQGNSGETIPLFTTD